MPGDHRLVDTNILVHAYTVSDERKHRADVALVEPVWGGQPAATTLQNLCEFFVVVTRKVAKPLSPAEAQVIVEGGAGRVPVARDRSRPRDGAEGHRAREGLPGLLLGRPDRRVHARTWRTDHRHRERGGFPEDPGHHSPEPLQGRGPSLVTGRIPGCSTIPRRRRPARHSAPAPPEGTRPDPREQLLLLAPRC